MRTFSKAETLQIVAIKKFTANATIPYDFWFVYDARKRAIGWEGGFAIFAASKRPFRDDFRLLPDGTILENRPMNKGNMLIHEMLETRILMLEVLADPSDTDAEELSELFPNCLLFDTWACMNHDELNEEIVRTIEALEYLRKVE